MRYVGVVKSLNTGTGTGFIEGQPHRISRIYEGQNTCRETLRFASRFGFHPQPPLELAALPEETTAVSGEGDKEEEGERKDSEREEEVLKKEASSVEARFAENAEKWADEVCGGAPNLPSEQRRRQRPRGGTLGERVVACAVFIRSASRPSVLRWM